MDGSSDIESMSYELAEFYTEVRGLVVVFLFFIILFSAAHVTLQFFLAKSEIDTKLDRSDRSVHQLIIGICTFTLTISLTTYSLLPFSIIANEILLGFKDSYYVQWLDAQLVRDLALVVNMGTKIVCILFPFSYFLSISHGFHAAHSSFSSRLFEACCSLLFFYILVYGTIWGLGSSLSALLRVMVGESHTLSVGFTVFSSDPMSSLMDFILNHSWIDFVVDFLFQILLYMLESLQLFLSLFGLLLLFTCAPFGLLSLGFYVVTLILETLPQIRSKLALWDDLTEVHFDALYVKDGIQSLILTVNSHLRWCDLVSVLSREELTTSSDPCYVKQKILATLKTRLPVLQHQLCHFKRRASRGLSTLIHDIFQPFFPCLIFGVIFCLFHLMQAFVFFNIIGLTQRLIHDYFYPIPPHAVTLDNTTRQSYSDGRISTFMLGHKPASKFGHIGAFLQICVIHFLLFVSLWGVYSVPALTALRPRSRSLSLEAIWSNVLLLFLFTSALPLQSNLLGLTTLTVPNFLETKPVGVLVDHVTSATKCRKATCTTCHLPTHNVDDFYSTPQTETIFTKRFMWPFSFVTTTPQLFDQSSTHSLIDDAPITDHLHPHNTSLWSQFVSKAFGDSTPSHASHGLIIVILLYNICFLITSIWIAGRRLRDVTLSIGLEMVTSLRYWHFDLPCSINHRHNSTARVSALLNPEKVYVDVFECSSPQSKSSVLCIEPDFRV